MTNNPLPRSPSFALFAPATVTGVKSFKRQLTQILFFSRLNAHTKKTASEKTLRFQITFLKPFNIRTEHRKTQEGRVEVRGPRLPPCRVHRGSKCVWNSWEAEQDGIDRQGATERQMNLRPPSFTPARRTFRLSHAPDKPPRPRGECASVCQRNLWLPDLRKKNKKKKAEKTAVPSGERVHYSRAPSSAQPAPAV